MKHLSKIKIFNIPEGFSFFPQCFLQAPSITKSLKLTVWVFLFNVTRWSSIYIYVFHKMITSRDFISNELSLLLYFTWKKFFSKAIHSPQKGKNVTGILRATPPLPLFTREETFTVSYILLWWGESLTNSLGLMNSYECQTLQSNLLLQLILGVLLKVLSALAPLTFWYSSSKMFCVSSKDV